MTVTSRQYDIARTALDLLVEHWEDDPDTVAPLPDRQLVGNGFVIWDCEQIVVAVERTFGMDADPTIESFVPAGAKPIIAMQGLTLAVWILRCTPDLSAEGEVITIPEAADIEESAQEIYADADRVVRLLARQQRLGNFVGASSLGFESWTSEGPEGGFGGGVTRLRVGLI